MNSAQLYVMPGSRSFKTTPFDHRQLVLSEPGGAWRQEVIQRLQELVKLERGWDGYRGNPVAFDVAVFALNLLEVACGDNTPAPQIVPGSNGDLQIEWHTEAGDLELWVRKPYSVHAWRHLVGYAEEGEEDEFKTDFLKVSQWIVEVTEPQGAVRAAA